MIYIFICTLLVIIDQITKVLVYNHIYNGEITIIKDIFSLTYVENYGAAWGILSEYDFFLKLLPPILVLVIFFYIYRYKPSKIETFSGILVISGALGNFIDRIRLGFVIDFFDFKIWPVFNFADICIVVGCLLMVLTLFRKDEVNGN